MQILSSCYSDTINQPDWLCISQDENPEGVRYPYLLFWIEITVSASRPQNGCRWIPEKLQKFYLAPRGVATLFPSNYRWNLASSSLRIFFSLPGFPVCFFSLSPLPSSSPSSLSHLSLAFALALDKCSTSLWQEYANILSKKSNELNFITSVLLDAWTPSKTIYPKFVESWLFSIPVRKLSEHHRGARSLNCCDMNGVIPTFVLFQLILNLRKPFNFFWPLLINIAIYVSNKLYFISRRKMNFIQWKCLALRTSNVILLMNAKLQNITSSCITFTLNYAYYVSV